MSRTFFTHSTLLDGLNAARPNSTVVVEGNRIVAVAPSQDAPTPEPGDRIFDLEGSVLMPGMFMCHFHAAMDSIMSYIDLDMKYPANYLTLVAARNAARMLHVGFTSAIGAGSPDNIDVVLKHAINDGLMAGPRFTACGRHLCTTGESLDSHPGFWKTGFLGFGHPCDGADEFRKAIRTEIKDGVDIIKLHVTGGHGSNYDMSIMPITYAELEAAVDAAHERGKKIRSHSANKEGILACIKAGVDLIDHADCMDDECIDAFVKNGTTITAGVHVTQTFINLIEAASKSDVPPGPLPTLSSPFFSPIASTVEESYQSMANYRKFLPRAQQAGVNIVNGDDAGAIWPHGYYADELTSYVEEIGISPLDVLRWATSNPARFLGQGDIGIIAEGNLADMLVIDGNPAEDISVLQQRDKLKAIMKDGLFVRCALTDNGEASSQRLAQPLERLDVIMA